MRKKIWLAVGFTVVIGFIYVLMLIHPNWLYGHQYTYRNYEIYSDQPISSKIEFVIDDALSRIEHSELFQPESKFKLYLSNDDRRFAFFTRNRNAGGVVNFVVSGNIFIRKNDIAKNQLIPPKTWVNSLSDRPLSYFVAHESVHSLQRKFDRFLVLKSPIEITEGYADYIAKNKSKSIESLTQDLRNNSPTMNPENGLYDRYHLYVSYLIELKGYDFERIVNEQPDLEKVLAELKTH